MNSITGAIFDILSAILRKLDFLPRGKVGVFLNKVTYQEQNNPIKMYKANNGLTYISDLRSYTENYVPWTGEYEGKTMKTILPIVPTDKNVLDIGANVGYWTVNLANQIQKKQKVYAFEPILSNFERINEMLKINNLTSKVFAYNIGLGEKKGRANFEINEYDKKHHASTFNSTLVINSSGNCLIESLDDFANKEGIKDIGFIKIDVEGFEIKFLKGARKFLTQNRPIIYGEFTPEIIIEKGDDPESLFSFFTDYTFLQECSNGTFKKIVNKKYKRDILLIPNEQIDDLINKGLKIVV